MVQAIENWAELRGRIAHIDGGQAPAMFVAARLEVSSVSDVPPFPNLFAGEAGATLDILIPAGVVDALRLETGTEVALRVQRTPRGNMVHRESMIVLRRA